MRRAHLVNYALYQIGWFACVLGAASHRPWTGCLIALTLVGVHLTRSLERSIEVRLMALATAVGAIVEMVQIATGMYPFTSGTVIDALPPTWLLTMWAQFATTFRHSLRTVICAGHRKRRYLGRSGGPSRSSPASASARSRSWSR